VLLIVRVLNARPDSLLIVLMCNAQLNWIGLFEMSPSSSLGVCIFPASAYEKVMRAASGSSPSIWSRCSDCDLAGTSQHQRAHGSCCDSAQMFFNGFVPFICIGELCLLGLLHYVYDFVLKCSRKRTFQIANYLGANLAYSSFGWLVLTRRALACRALGLLQARAAVC
jgi:hypothetical protein